MKDQMQIEMDGFQKDMSSRKEQMEKILQEMKIQIYKVSRKYANSFILLDMFTVYVHTKYNISSTAVLRCSMLNFKIIYGI